MDVCTAPSIKDKKVNVSKMPPTERGVGFNGMLVGDGVKSGKKDTKREINFGPFLNVVL